MVDKSVHLLELFRAVIFQQVRVIFAQIDHAFDLLDQLRRLELAVGFFTQVEDGQAGGHVLVIRRITRDQVSGRLDHRFMNVGGANTFVELDV